MMKTDKWTGSAESVAYKPSTGTFLLLLVLLAAAVAGLSFLAWYVPTVGLRSIHPALPYVLAAVMILAGLVLFGGAALVTAAMAGGRLLFYSRTLHWLLVKLYLPLLVLAGGILRIPKIRIERAFIDLNNRMVHAMGRKFRPEKILILMPHCIQWDDCKLKVTREVKNCAGCGRCEVGDLVKLSEEFGIELFISTGGTVARRKVIEHRPDAVVAVACERDLTSGLQDAYPLPVMAVVNKRPHGYCMETGVDMAEIRQAVMDLVA